MADHVHLFTGAPPTESLLGIVQALEGISARVFNSADNVPAGASMEPELLHWDGVGMSLRKR